MFVGISLKKQPIVNPLTPTESSPNRDIRTSQTIICKRDLRVSHRSSKNRRRIDKKIRKNFRHSPDAFCIRTEIVSTSLSMSGFETASLFYFCNPHCLAVCPDNFICLLLCVCFLPRISARHSVFLTSSTIAGCPINA